MDTAVLGIIPAVGSHSLASLVQLRLKHIDLYTQNIGNLFHCGKGCALSLGELAVIAFEMDSARDLVRDLVGGCCIFCNSCLLCFHLSLSDTSAGLIDCLSLGLRKGVGEDTMSGHVFIGETIEAILICLSCTQGVHLCRGIGVGSQSVQDEVGIRSRDAVQLCDGLNADTIVNRQVSLLHIDLGAVFQFDSHLTIFDFGDGLHLCRTGINSLREALCALFILRTHCVGSRCVLLTLLCRIRPGSLGSRHFISKSF